MGQPMDLKSLIESIPGKTLAAKLRPIMPEIDKRIQEGVQHQEIIDALTSEGIEVNLNTFRSYLYRYRSKKKPQAEKPVSTPTPLPQADGNSLGDDEENTSAEQGANDLETILDPAKRDALSDKYMGAKKPLFKKRNDEK